ncbi:unnamed protein product [Owenia fusiformis]|uniref:Uncharacterized protein n=1 Tax=Owenia fusiformis TaxID=6347 RepID=A0A8S4PWE8_OWEFU|nr:unnamed protein product [Owenia fusiformis]
MLFAVGASFVFTFILGSLWYSPLLFGRTWARLAYPNTRMEDLGKGGSFVYPMVVSNVGHLLMCAFLNMLLRNYIHASSIQEATQSSLLVAVIVVSPQVAHTAFQKKPWLLYLIDQSYDATVIVACSVIMTWLG